MIPFKKVKPQYAEHVSGFSVFVEDREHIGYKDDILEAKIDADLLCGVVPLYVKTLNIKTKSQSQPVDTKLLIERIVQGLSFLGIRSELIDDGG